MDNVTFIEIDTPNGEKETYAFIANEDGSSTSMTKAHYDAMQAEQSTPSVIDEA